MLVYQNHESRFTLSMLELKALAIFITENLQKGFIRKSISPIVMGRFLVPKPNGEYRTVVDFRPVNEIVVDNRNPIPNIDDLMTYLSDARVFTKIDLRATLERHFGAKPEYLGFELKLIRLNQGNMSVADFNIRFRQIVL